MINKAPKVAIVILNWNGQHLLEKFLPSVLKTNYSNYKIYVGDNASTDSSVDYLKRNFPQIEIISNKQNYGFARGYNEVLKGVKADYLVLLNSDVEVTANWLNPVIEAMERDVSIGAAQPKIKAFSKKSHFEYAGAAGGFIDYLGYPFCRGRLFDNLEEDLGHYDDSGEVFWASGCAFFIREQAWLSSGGFDERFFAHMEEIDLCWRLKLAGYKIWYEASSTVFHLGGGTLSAESPNKTYLNFRNNLLMMHKNMQNKGRFWILTFRIILDFIALLKFVSGGKLKNAWAVSRAHQSFFILIFNRNNIYKTIKFNNLFINKIYKKSIIYAYFIKGKRIYSELNQTDFS